MEHFAHFAHLAYTKPVAIDVQAACQQEIIAPDMISRPVTFPVLPSGQNQLRVKEKVFAALPEQQAANSFESAPNFGPFAGSVFIQLPPKLQVESFFQITFDEINYSLPLFDTQQAACALGNDKFRTSSRNPMAVIPRLSG